MSKPNRPLLPPLLPNNQRNPLLPPLHAHHYYPLLPLGDSHQKKEQTCTKRINDLVFLKYNQKIKARYDRHDVIDPISLDDTDDSNEWLLGKMGIEPSIDADGETVLMMMMMMMV
jgi:hypothetical protein